MQQRPQAVVGRGEVTAVVWIFGHLGVAGMVRATQRDPHGSRAFVLLCIVAVLPDVLDVAFAMSGICSPFGLYTHTLPAIALETAVVGGIAWFATRSARVCVAFAAMVRTFFGICPARKASRLDPIEALRCQ